MSKRKHPDGGHDYNSANKKKKRQPTTGLNQAKKKDIQWFKGRLCEIKQNNAWFLRPTTELPNGYNKSKDVFLRPNFLPQHILPVMEGDTLEFVLGDRDKTKPMARKVRVSQYTPRTCKEITEYMNKLIKELDGDNVKKILGQVLPCTAMWKFFGSPVFQSTKELTRIAYIKLLFKLFDLILHHGAPFKTLLKDAITNLTQGKIFQEENKQSLPAIIASCNYENNELLYSEEQKTSISAELIRRFCQDVIRQVSSATRCLLPTVTAITKKKENESTEFLCTLLSLNVGRENGFIVNTRMRMELPSIPTDQELAGHLVEKDQNLTPVRTNIPYDNPEQYMDTYFRLIRAEMFSAIQHGIKDLKASTLDPRDMNVYHNIYLAGFDLQDGRFSLAIHFTPTKKVKRWEASPQLMYGNLVCLSMNRKFDDVIWATVFNRNTELLNQCQIIMLELLDENVKSISEIINSLQIQGGCGVMVESPNYYHSLSPILRSLKEFDMENFPLQKEIIYVSPRRELPEYLKNATFDTLIVCLPQTASNAKKTPGDAPDARKDGSNTTEACEKENILEMKATECISSDAMCIDDSNEIIIPPSEFPWDEKINMEPGLREKLPFEIPNTKPMLEVNTESTNVGQQICINQSHVHEAILSDKSVEQMDSDSIAENILYYKSLSKAEQCADTNKSRKSNSRKTQEGRMDVEQFLKTFNSSSESSLEASQCDALIHALTNKLAVIQGPPGCGKTFIGVKIVQLLLSLSPKLKKPILLLTYKNHALDEFLKHMLEFCDKPNIVRIGGRSKEPELEECNLKNIQKSIRYEKATLTEIENTRSEIYKIESKIKKITEKVEESSYLTNRSLAEELSEEQIRSLILEADQIAKPMNYLVDRSHHGKMKWKEQLLNDISKEYSSVKEFFQMAVTVEESKQSFIGLACLEVLNRALKHWFPGRRELKRMKDFQTEFILQLQSDKTTEDASEDGNDGDGDDDDESGDEDYVKQVLETRMAAGARHETRSNSLIIFDSAKTKKGQGVLISISDYPPDIVVNSQILSVNNLWSLNEVQRLQFLYCILNKKTASVSRELNDLVKKLQSLKSRKEELEITDKVKFLSQKKIIGVTITGASINHDLLHHIGPSVVIVEEAAEILEPSLLASLTPSIEHLILIGDHKQLRPQVDTYELRKNFQFDVSMMERLIESGFPFRCLVRQNRMRPEFSALLKDIYPNLQDNLQLVLQNEPLKCIAKSMFFWSHDDPETKDRTYTNVKEADRVIALVKYLLSNGVCPSDITVLSAYLGQTKHLRKLIKREKDNSPKLSEKGFVQVQTIDNYQGDENKYVIISLVRSNTENNIGFLKAMNRRCVAQSRAKCGMYFVGNRNTLCGAKGLCWSGFISSMEKQGCVGDKIPLRCTKHDISKYEATDRKDIWKIMAKPTVLCNEPCGDYYQNCEKHRCKHPCRSQHNHNYCPELVDDQFPDCGHYVKRTCSDDILRLFCEYMVNVDLPCGHKGEKKCYQNVSDVICTVRVTAIFPRCGHKTEKRCHENIEKMKCRDRCKKMKLCGKHPCKEVCGKDHGHYNCSEIIDYNFPNCGHPSPKKKSCSRKITWNCRHKVLFKGDCGHEIQRECYLKESEVKCPVTPCVRLRKCGHPCTNACGDDCEKGECKHCQAEFKEKMEEFHKVARAKYFELEETIKKKEIPKFSRHELHDTGPTAAEYQEVKYQVLKFIQPCHHWFPTITKIEKVTNLDLEKKFEAAKTRAFGDYIVTKFHGTSNEGVKRIIKEGFKMPGANPHPRNRRGMYGQGIYFATDSSKSARGISTKGSQKLLLCQVILGKSLKVEKADRTLNKRKLELEKCDSVYAPRGTEVINDEFVIFDPNQALPQYIIHFSSTKNFVPPSPSALTPLPYYQKNMKASRSVNFQDPFEMFYNFAESHFRRMAASSKPPFSSQLATISSIDIVINKDLEDKFEDTKKKFQADGIPDKEILAYHGTDPKNIDSILESNLQLSYAKRQLYGKGNYFSEFPAVSLDYGQGLLLCRILPGKEYVDSTNCDIPKEYNSKKVVRSQLTGVSAANASGDMIIIENSDQILPFFVIHR